MTTRDNVLATVDERQIRFVDLWFTDITGGVKSVTVPAASLDAVMEQGARFDGSSLESLTRVAESDMLLMPDVDTFAVLPWGGDDNATARMICNVYTTDGQPFIGDPRAMLIRGLEQAAEMGFRYKTGMELEFFLFEDLETLQPCDTHTYFDLSNDRMQSVRRDMLQTLDAMGIEVLSAHHEIGSGQHEIDLNFDDALSSADRIFSARVALKAVARSHGLHCTFMPRPSMDMPGSGMHTHQSLHDLETDVNVFSDAGGEDEQVRLSPTAEYFLAGQLDHAPALAAVLSPLVNSYKRLGTSFEAPVYVTWAHVNRGALIRVPGVPAGMEDHTRLEIRLPDPSSNPYLVSAAMLAAGLDGIRQQMQVPAPIDETILQQDRARLRQVQVLPNSLRQALEALSDDEVMLAALGPYISDRYLAAKRKEYDDYSRQVTQWELKEYLGRY